MEDVIRKTVVTTYDYRYDFGTMNVFRQFIGRQRDAWRWIDDLLSPFATEEYSRNFIDKPLKLAELEFAADGPADRHIHIQSYVSSDGELGTLAQEIKKEHGAIVGFMFLLVSHPEITGKLNLYSSLDAFFKNENLYYERALAMQLYFESIDATKITTASRHNAKEKEILNFRRAHEAAIENASSRLRNAVTEIEFLRDAQIQDTQAASRKNKRRVELYRALLTKAARSGNESLKKSQTALQAAREDLVTAQDTYHAQIDLKASVQYWTDEMERHSRTALIWLIAVVVTTGLTFLAPVIYYHLGGVTALSRSTTEQTALVDSSKTVTTHYPTSTNAPALNANAPGNQKTTQDPTYSPLVAHIADLTGAALLIALLTIFIRLTLRQFNTHSYLKHESAERLVMTKTYLALSNEGKLSADGDRKLVLEALFRATQSNGVPETSISTPIELIIKAVTEKRSTQD
ncbi:hypothetical protein ACTACH_04595 [Pseudomonas syringae]|uniref:hypothetical protein n=1 Tax=Pseudomonas syringae TaxID=317 RepID=UPI0005C9A8EB|nr:hypothetical protein [Pseudomonas syringae]